MKLDDDNLTLKTTLICSAVEQPLIDSGRKATSSCSAAEQPSLDSGRKAISR
jgi:hypothetical protein